MRSSSPPPQSSLSCTERLKTLVKNKMMGNDSNSDEGGGGRTTTTTTTAAALKKGPWSAAEDAILIDYVQRHGEGNWNSVQKHCGLARCGKSCRLRWANHLRPNLKKGSFTPEEEMLILQLHAQFGNKWARMAAQMPGRTDNEIKNYWNTRIKRRQRAGLPLHPTRTSSGPRPPPSTSPSSPIQLFNQPALPNPLMPGTPRVKRIRDDGLTFQFPVISPQTHHHHPQQINDMFHYNNNNAYGNGGNFNEMNMNVLMSTMALPSTQMYNGGDGGCGLMDTLLQDQGGKLVFSDQPPIINENASDGEDKDLFVDSLARFEELSCSNGISMKRKQSELEEANPPESTHDDISRLIDMISTPAMPPPPEWQTLAAADSCEISNGGQSSVVTDDELGLELQHLASSLSPADQEWNIGSCPWNNMPGIG